MISLRRTFVREMFKNGGILRNTQLTDMDFDRIIRHSSVEDRAIWILAAETGFRIDDLLRVRQYQITRATSSDHPFLILAERKTGKTRSVPLTPKALDAIATLWRYVVKRHPLAYFFQARRHLSGQKGKLHRATVYRHFSQALKDTKLDGKGYTVHSLRKLYALHAYERTGSLLAVQEDLNHTSLNTPMLYVANLRL